MDKIRFGLLPGEAILLTSDSARHGVKGNHDDELVLTNQRLVWIELGMFGVKQMAAYPLEHISSAAVGIASNGSKQFQIVYGDHIEGFSFYPSSSRELKLWAMAVNDQISEHSSYFDAAFYERFSEENLKKTAKRITDGEVSEDDVNLDLASLGNAAFSILKSGNLSASSIKKKLKATSGKGGNSAIFKGIKDELGITELQNDFLGMFGIEGEETNTEREERLLDAAFDFEAYQGRAEVVALQQQRMASQMQAQEISSIATKNLDDQIEAIKKLKELVDMGALAQEEFELKKKELLGL